MMRVLALAIVLSASPLMGQDMIVVDASPNSNMVSVEITKEFIEIEFADGNFGNASFLCEYLEKRNVDEPRLKLIWAASQARIGNWNKAERLYSSVVSHKKSTKRQKSLACVYLSKQQTDNKNKEEYAVKAIEYSSNDLVVEMVAQIYLDLQTDALSKSDRTKAQYYKNKYDEFVKNSSSKRAIENGTKVGSF